MSPGLSFALLLGAATAGSLAVKAQAIDYRVAPDSARFAADLRARLDAAGMESTIEHRRISQVETVVGHRGDCTIRLSDGTRANEMASVYSRQARELGPPRYFYAGEWSVSPPMFRSEAGVTVQKSLARLGVAIGRPVIIAVSASPACGLDSIDLATVRMHLTVPKP